MFVYNEDNVCVFTTTSFKERRWDGLAFPKGVFRSTCRIPADLLNDGVYRVSVLFVEDTSVVINVQNDLLDFEIQDDHSERGQWYGKWQGVTRPHCSGTRLVSKKSVRACSLFSCGYPVPRKHHS